MLTSLFLLAAAQTAGAGTAPAAKAAPVELYRKFTVGERLSYAVKASYTTEERSGTQITFLPADIQQSYAFTLDVLKSKADGFAEVKYLRPNFKVSIDVGDGPQARTTKVDQRLKMTVSPLNEPTDIVDETPKKKPKSTAEAGVILMRAARRQADGAILALLGQFANEIQSLSFFTGPFDVALDLAPKLPIDPVSPGDTWKSTVGYAPQALKGEAKKQATQRLDYTYTYLGLVAVGKTKVQRIVAKLSLKTDVADFGRQLAGDRAEIFTKAPITLDAEIVFDLDPKTLHTLRATATSRNTVQLYVKGFSAPLDESRAKGTTTLSLISRTVPPPAKAGTKPRVRKG